MRHSEAMLSDCMWPRVKSAGKVPCFILRQWTVFGPVMFIDQNAD